MNLRISPAVISTVCLCEAQQSATVGPARRAGCPGEAGTCAHLSAHGAPSISDGIFVSCQLTAKSRSQVDSREESALHRGRAGCCWAQGYLQGKAWPRRALHRARNEVSPRVSTALAGARIGDPTTRQPAFLGVPWACSPSAGARVGSKDQCRTVAARMSALLRAGRSMQPVVLLWIGCTKLVLFPCCRVLVAKRSRTESRSPLL